MPVQLLEPVVADRLRAQSLTYVEVGATRSTLPAGYHHMSRRRVLPPGVDFDEVTRSLLTWQVQARAGLAVEVSSHQIEEGAVALMRFGIGRLAIRIPCRVVSVVDEPDCKGYSYGTLPGHPEAGEEAFSVRRRADGRIDFSITAFSRPATRLARAGGPVTSAVQRFMTNRYLRTLG